MEKIHFKLLSRSRDSSLNEFPHSAGPIRAQIYKIKSNSRTLRTLRDNSEIKFFSLQKST